MRDATPPGRTRGPDPESAAWLAALSSLDGRRDDAVAELHALLLRAARFECARRGAPDAADLDDTATQAADDALMAVLAKLDTYRGESRFTTWAYKFALLEAGTAMRRRRWRGREVPLAEDGWARLADERAAPDTDAETAELLDRLREAMAAELTSHQRDVLVALVLNDVPIDVLAERLGTTRGALYKTLHDARRKLRAALPDGAAA